ncbi:MAG: F420-dependent methylenetetrahydromethanopterin dehydrogenase [Candidatus Methanomethylicota archaeon]|nr:MAG: F420-dependent methylenetetrahydromethanopterin dehydrogenase [Candidatus Verstraetearchaeota archaeon]
MNQLRIAVVKFGCIGSSPLIEIALDERANREDILVRVFSTGGKMDAENCIDVADAAVKFNPQLIVNVTPNAALEGPRKGRMHLKDKLPNIPIIVISDEPAKKAEKDLKENGFGYIIIQADPMIGARRDFLDATEMVLFNSDILKVLAVTGVIRMLIAEIDKVISAIKSGGEVKLPQIIADAYFVVENYGGFSNPYAKAKAIASYEAARRVARLSTTGCYVLKDREAYMPMVAAAHELLRIAAKLADEAREIEKSNDTVYRTPHVKSGEKRYKVKFMEKAHR